MNDVETTQISLPQQDVSDVDLNNLGLKRARFVQRIREEKIRFAKKK